MLFRSIPSARARSTARRNAGAGSASRRSWCLHEPLRPLAPRHVDPGATPLGKVRADRHCVPRRRSRRRAPERHHDRRLRLGERAHGAGRARLAGGQGTPRRDAGPRVHGAAPVQLRRMARSPRERREVGAARQPAPPQPSHPRNVCTPATVAPLPPQRLRGYPRNRRTPTPATVAPHPRNRCGGRGQEGDL